jgi:ribonuclease Z
VSRGLILGLVGAIVVATLAGLGAILLGSEPVATRLYARQVEARLGSDRLADLPDGLTVAFCGTGSPLPDPTRAQSCTAVVAGGRVFVVDAGSGSSRNLAFMGIAGRRVEGVLLTHFHSDHITDLASMALLRWVDDAQREPLAVYGPMGVSQVVDGFNAAYGLDYGYRTGHHGEDIAPRSGAGLAAFEFSTEPDEPVTVLADANLTITAMSVDHAPASPAVAYRFDHGGRSVVISGDLIVERSPAFIGFAAGADMMVVEALQPRLAGLITDQARAVGRDDLATITEDILDYHTTPEAAADAAALADSKVLVLTHIVPALPSRLLHAAFLGDARSRFSGRLEIAEDGMVVILPAGSGAIRFEDWL